MPLYYLNENLNVKGERLPMFSVHGLWQLSEKSRNELMELKRIREIRTVDVASFEQFEDYAIMISELGFETLGDFAGANPDTLPDDLRPIQLEALAYLHPQRPSSVTDTECC